jgi:hypothetical protein
MTLAFLVCAGVTAISAFISLGFSIAAVAGQTGSIRTLALYACVRSLALAVVSVASFVTGSGQWLQAAALAMIIVQAGDAAIGATIKDSMKTFGPAGTALANLAALAWFVGRG